MTMSIIISMYCLHTLNPPRLKQHFLILLQMFSCQFLFINRDFKYFSHVCCYNTFLHPLTCTYTHQNHTSIDYTVHKLMCKNIFCKSLYSDNTKQRHSIIPFHRPVITGPSSSII